MYTDTRHELAKIRATLDIIVKQLDQMESDEEIEAANAIGDISNSIKEAISKSIKAMLLSDDNEQFTTGERVWQVGDLVQRVGQSTILVIGIDGDQQRVINCLGHIDLLNMVCTNPASVHNTGLAYKYANREQAYRDFRAGLFTPYFEIL